MEEKPRNQPRIPLQTKVNLEFERFNGFISEYSSNISEGGMFVRTNEPKPIGTVVSFEFRLRDNFKLIQGLGEVTWIRAIERSPEKPMGMGIRFHELDAKSRELIRTMVDHYTEGGGKPFQLESAQDPDLPPPPETTPAAIEDEFKALFSSPEDGTTGPIDAPAEPASIEAPSSDWMEPKPESQATLKSVGTIEDESVKPKEPFVGLSTRLEGDPSIQPRQPRRASRRTSFKWLTLIGVVALAVGAAYVFHRPILALVKTYTKKKSPPVTAKPESLPVASPVAVSSPTPEPTAEPTVAPKALSSIQRLTWERTTEGTWITLWGDGVFETARFNTERVAQGSPREVIKILGVHQPPIPAKQVLATSEVRQLRMGYHPGSGAGEFHIVADLGSRNVKLKKSEPAGDALRLLFSSN